MKKRQNNKEYNVLPVMNPGKRIEVWVLVQIGMDFHIVAQYIQEKKKKCNCKKHSLFKNFFFSACVVLKSANQSGSLLFHLHLRGIWRKYQCFLRWRIMFNVGINTATVRHKYWRIFW